MSVTKKKIIRWIKMLTGKSIDHVRQDVGRVYSLERLEGYYNDFTKKVIKSPDLLKNQTLPKTVLENGDIIDFPTAIFQYGLGAYDLYLMTKKEIYLSQFIRSARWALDNQDEGGAWSNFFFIYPEHPYSGMTQGEGCSLLVRAYVFSQDKRYLAAATKAIDFMLKNIDEGGTTDYSQGIVFFEYTNKPPVLNGWVFALWGLLDIYKATNDARYKRILDEAIATLERDVEKFSMKNWSYYNLGGLVASPFYHRIHIAQMTVLFEQTNIKIFKSVALKWKKQSRNLFFKCHAFIKKAVQKIKE